LSDGAGTLFITNATHYTSVEGNLDWTTFTRLFIARQVSTTLTFVSQNSGNGGVFLDAVSVEPIVAPLLVVSNAGNLSVSLSWTTNAPLFQLCSAPSLTQPIEWTVVTNQPIVSGNSFSVNVSNIVGTKFFVLRAP
jgi:hypothetical protein